MKSMKALVFASYIAAASAHMRKLPSNQWHELQLAPDVDENTVPDIADPELDPGLPTEDDIDGYGEDSSAF